MNENQAKRYDSDYQRVYLEIAKEKQLEIDNYKKRGVYHNYKHICKKEAKLIKKIAGDLQDDRVYFSIYVYLYRNGYLSKNRYFEFDIDEEEVDCNLRSFCFFWQGSLQKYSNTF